MYAKLRNKDKRVLKLKFFLLFIEKCCNFGQTNLKYGMLSQSCIYGLQTCIYLSLPEQAGKKVRVATIAADLGISPSFLSKVVFMLVKAGIIDSVRGVSGGVCLTKPPSDIHIIEIVIAIEGKDFFDECLLRLPQCSDATPCTFHDEWKEERKRMTAMFTQATLAVVAKRASEDQMRIH